MSDLKQTMQRAREFIAANLAECCRDELDWQNTALLRDGKLREAAAIYSKVDATHAIPLAQAEIARQAMRFASRTQPETVDGDPIGDLQAESRQAKLDDFIASMKTQPEATAPAPEQRIADALAELASAQKPLDADVSKIIFDNMWALYGDEFGTKAAPAQDLSAAILAIDIPPKCLTHQASVYGFKEGLKAAAALASSANALSATIDKDAKIAAQRERIMELEHQLAVALNTPVNDWCPECHARESSGDALSAGDSEDTQFLSWVKSHRKSWLVEFRRRAPEPYRAAILQSQKNGAT